MDTSNYHSSHFIGTTHNFITEEEGGISYKYVFNPKMAGVKFANYLEIEKYKKGKLYESIMVSKKQVVYQLIPKDYTWMKIIESGNEYSTMKHYTKKEGSEWRVEKKIEGEGGMVNLEYDVKSSIICKCLKLTKNERNTD